MDALLRYLLYKVTFSILFAEILIMLICVVAIIIVKFYTQWSTNRRKQIQGELTVIFEKALFNPEPFKGIFIPSHLCQFRNLIEVLENFDHRFNDERWQEIKEYIINAYLLKRTESYANSLYWYKRQLAARCYLLNPQNANEKILSKLLKDKRYLVRLPAVVCITKTRYKELFFEMIRQMSQETQLSQFPYRDALMQVDQEKFLWIESLLFSESDPAITVICLDILSTRYSGNSLSQVAQFLNSPYRECRLKAIEALANIPSKEAMKLLEDHLEDSDFKIRESSIMGLEKLYAIQAVSKIGHLLNDPIWSVRLQAAKTLKRLGKKGIEILDSQSHDKAPKAYEIAQYILALP